MRPPGWVQSEEHPDRETWPRTRRNQWWTRLWVRVWVLGKRFQRLDFYFFSIFPHFPAHSFSCHCRRCRRHHPFNLLPCLLGGISVCLPPPQQIKQASALQAGAGVKPCAASCVLWGRWRDTGRCGRERDVIMSAWAASGYLMVQSNTGEMRKFTRRDKMNFIDPWRETGSFELQMTEGGLERTGAWSNDGKSKSYKFRPPHFSLQC